MVKPIRFGSVLFQVCQVFGFVWFDYDLFGSIRFYFKYVKYSGSVWI